MYVEHSLRDNQHDKTLMMKKSDVDGTGCDQGHSKGGNKAVYTTQRRSTINNRARVEASDHEVYAVYDGRS